MYASSLFRLLPVAALVLALFFPCQVRASDLMRYKELHNEFIKVTDVKERERTEERYLESNGKVTLQKVPYKEVMVTAELLQKPPSSMETMFNAASDPNFKICMVPFDAANKPMEEDCQSFRFQNMVKGNVGTAFFRPAEGTARYEFRVAQKQGDKGSSIKLWTPVD